MPCKASYDRDPERWREQSRQYYQRNKVRLIKLASEYAKANPEQKNEANKRQRVKLRLAAMEAYGGHVCSWCGIDEPSVLTIDHISNGGSEHRKSLGRRGGVRFYHWLRLNGYPSGFQVLCFNCNVGKHMNGGVLPESLRGRCND